MYSKGISRVQDGVEHRTENTAYFPIYDARMGAQCDVTISIGIIAPTATFLLPNCNDTQCCKV